MAHAHHHCLDRRAILKVGASLAAAAAIGGFTRFRPALAAPIEVPAVDRLRIRVLIDSAHDIFLAGQEAGGVTAQAGARGRGFRQTLHNQWGLSCISNPRSATSSGWPCSISATHRGADQQYRDSQGRSEPDRFLIVSHGHFDHYGGLVGFLEAYRDVLPADVKLYVGGEENFCQRFARTPVEGQFTDFGALDRPAVEAQRVAIILAEDPTVVEDGHVFTTGAIKRRSFETVLPNTKVGFEQTNGLGCDASHFRRPSSPARSSRLSITTTRHGDQREGPGPRGHQLLRPCRIINSIGQAQEVSGVEKVHALVGGFHLAPARPDYLARRSTSSGRSTRMSSSHALQRHQLRAGDARAAAGEADPVPPPARSYLWRLALADGGRCRVAFSAPC
jgi:7,8-dihydropterin-6-yl-methyl-4-(beta-D-ribofuranosyl)aminobenzene 5'-phosphate synthase